MSTENRALAQWVQRTAEHTQPEAIHWCNGSEDEYRQLWPGFGDNIRVLEWILRRTEGKVGARSTPIGLVPEPGGLDTEGLPLSAQQLNQLLHVDWNAWSEEAVRGLDFLARFGDRLPPELLRERAALLARLKDAQT